GGRCPGGPTLSRTRIATTGRSAPVPASNSFGSSLRWAKMAWRSAWLSGRTEPLGRSSSSKGNRRGLAMEASFLVVLASDPLGASPAMLLVRSRRARALTGRLGVGGGGGGRGGGVGPLAG